MGKGLLLLFIVCYIIPLHLYTRFKCYQVLFLWIPVIQLCTSRVCRMFETALVAFKVWHIVHLFSWMCTDTFLIRFKSLPNDLWCWKNTCLQQDYVTLSNHLTKKFREKYHSSAQVCNWFLNEGINLLKAYLIY